MKKTTLFIAFMLLFLIANAQYTTGTVNLNFGMSVEIETQPSEVTLTITGPNNKWFAVGFGGDSMPTVTDVFMYDDTNFFDKVGQTYAAPTNDSNQDWTIVSNTVNGSNRTIVATRALSTDDSNDYTFNNSASNIPVIYAHGSSLSLVQHVNMDLVNLTRTAVADIDKKKQLQFAMYPNPVNTTLNVVLPSNLEQAHIEIFNILGKRISKKQLNNGFNKIDVSAINAGIYLIKIIGNNSYGVKQFVKK